MSLDFDLEWAERYKLLKDRVEEQEAALAAMREALEKVITCKSLDYMSVTQLQNAAKQALSPGAGAALLAEVRELQKDRKRLRWLFRNPACIAYSKDGDDCWLYWVYDPHDEERGPFNGPIAASPEAAIDAAMPDSNNLRVKEKSVSDARHL